MSTTIFWNGSDSCLQDEGVVRELWSAQRSAPVRDQRDGLKEIIKALAAYRIFIGEVPGCTRLPGQGAWLQCSAC